MCSNSSQKEKFRGHSIHAYSGKGPMERPLKQEGGYLAQPALFLEFLTHFSRIIPKIAMNECPINACCAGNLCYCEGLFSNVTQLSLFLKSDRA